MTVDEFKLLAVDTKISVRDIRTGKYLKDKKNMVAERYRKCTQEHISIRTATKET